MAETLRYRDDQPVDHPAVTVDAFVDQSNAGSTSRARNPSSDPVGGAGAGWRIRTPGLMITNQLLYQLS